MYEYLQAGTYQIELRAFDPNTCIAEDFAYTSITVSSPDFSISDDIDICAGSPTQLLATGGTQYTWWPAIGLNDSTIANPVASPSDTTTYNVEILNPNGCTFMDSIKVSVVANIEPIILFERTGLCEGSRVISIVNESLNATAISWTMGDGTLLDDWQPVHEYSQDGEYRIIGTLVN